jgi:hypothetical protein
MVRRKPGAGGVSVWLLLTGGAVPGVVVDPPTEPEVMVELGGTGNTGGTSGLKSKGFASSAAARSGAEAPTSMRNAPSASSEIRVGRNGESLMARSRVDIHRYKQT